MALTSVWRHMNGDTYVSSMSCTMSSASEKLSTWSPFGSGWTVNRTTHTWSKNMLTKTQHQLFVIPTNNYAFYRVTSQDGYKAPATKCKPRPNSILRSPDWSGRRWYCFIMSQWSMMCLAVRAVWKLLGLSLSSFSNVSTVGWLFWKWFFNRIGSLESIL